MNYTKCTKKINGQNAQTSMLNALVHTMYSHYWDKKFIYLRHSPKYRGCSVVSSSFFNLILIKYLNHLRPVVSIGNIRQSQSHVFWDMTSCSLNSNYDMQTSMLLHFYGTRSLRPTACPTGIEAVTADMSITFYQTTWLPHYTRDECLSSPL